MPTSRARLAGRRVALTVALVAGIHAAPLRAQPTAPQTGAPLDEDQLLQSSIKQAKAQVAAGELAQALRTLQAAYQRVPTPALLWPIADLHLRLQQPKEGLEILDRYVAQVRPERMPPGQRLADVEQLRGQFQKQQAHLTVVGVRPGSTLVVDEVEVGRTPLAKPLVLNPGRHRLEVRSLQSVGSDLQLQPGQALQLNLGIYESRTGLASPSIAPMDEGPRRAPSRAPIVLGSLGLVAVAAGGALWGLDGYQSCAQAPMCPQELDSRAPGIALVSLGSGLFVGALSWWVHDLATRRKPAASSSGSAER